jgi:hypothetical protein
LNPKFSPRSGDVHNDSLQHLPAHFFKRGLIKNLDAELLGFVEFGAGFRTG